MICVLVLGLIFSSTFHLGCMVRQVLDKEVTIVGGGIAAALHAYHAHRAAIKNGTTVRVTILEKNRSISETTTSNLVPSLTPDEILSVVPRGKSLVEKLQYAFNQPGGIRVDDVEGINDSDAASHFIQQVEICCKDSIGYQRHTEAMMIDPLLFGGRPSQHRPLEQPIEFLCHQSKILLFSFLYFHTFLKEISVSVEQNKTAASRIWALALGLAFAVTLPVDCMVRQVLDNEVTIVGGGIAGALHAYYAHRDAVKNGTTARVTICEKNKSIADTTTLNVVFSLTPDEILCVIPRGSELMKKLMLAFNEPGGLRIGNVNFNDRATTTANIVPSLTPDEILSVVPRGKILVEKLQAAFNEPGGIRVDDVANVNNSDVAKKFMQQAEIYSHDAKGYQERTTVLLALGKMSMDLWQNMYDEADPELKAIMVASNFNPCREVSGQGAKALHDGYRIDLIYDIPNAAVRAEGMKADYQSLGYQNCTLLSPTEVMAIDPFLTSFCNDHATCDAAGVLQWHNDSIALWRPGGCLDTKVFMPKLYEYLKKSMGTYVDSFGKTQDCFQVLYDSEVLGLEFDTKNDKTIIKGVDFGGGFLKCNDSACKNSSYVFCPGEAVGTLNKLGLKEPAYAGFAGVSLLLNIPIPEDKIADYEKFSHCMEVHQEGVVLAWQARFIEGKIFIGVAGTKAFYGDQRPTKDQAFAKDRNLLQLNMVNDVLPEFISLAFGRDTKGQRLTQADMDLLEQKEIAKRWAGTRSVVFDGFPTLGVAYKADGTEVDNALITTHLGSGGVSFGPAAVAVSCSARNKATRSDALVDAVLGFARSDRAAQ